MGFSCEIGGVNSGSEWNLWQNTRKMRGEKDDEKVTASPMFPRLHVNDTEKGGPRAPPRNKMALYEQLSIPSQRFSSGSASLLPLPPNNNGSSLVPSMSSSNGGGYERSMFTQFCNSPAPSLLAEKIHSFSSVGMKLNTMMANQEWKSMKPVNSHSFASGPLSPTAKCNSFKPSNLSNFKNFLLQKLGDEDDLRVPSNNQLNHERKFKLRKGSGDLNSRLYVRNQIEDNAKLLQPSQDPVDRSASIHSSKDRNLEDESSSWSLKVKSFKSLKRTYSSMNQETDSGSMDNLNGLGGTNVQLNRECLAVRDEISLRDSIDKENAFKVRTELCPLPSLEEDDDDDTSPNGLENGSECHEDKNGRPVQVREVDRQDDVSNTCMMDSASILGLSPDDVVGVIGEKQFWKARRALINQQRVFAVQVFELHRLMKVQKLIARSPHLLLDDQHYMNKPRLNLSPVKKLPPKYILEASPRTVKPKDTSQKPDLRAECADENAVGNLPLPSVNNDTSKGLVTQLSNFGSYSGNAPTTPVTRNIKPSPWCFPPPGNQWLVSVMSPSEGLVYKPYTGPCPPTAGFMAPFYGSCGPMSLTPAGGDFLNTAYGVPASHQQGIGILPGTPPLGQTYFPPYGMPIVNPSVSSSAVEQMSPFTGGQTKDDHLSVGDINFIIPHQSSCNMSTQMSRVISCCLGKFQAAKESEVQGSTGSSPDERAKGDVLPLFPMEPIVQASDQNAPTDEEQTRVIKVVPHNPRLATESAARIFQSIQEGRKQYD